MIRLVRTLTLTFAAGMFVAACLPKSANFTGAEAIKRNEVTIVRTEYPIEFTQEGKLGDREKHALARFIVESQLRHGDVLTVESGHGLDGGARDDLARVLGAHGLYLNDAPVVASVAPDSNQAILMVDRYVVVPTSCPGTAEDPRNNWANAASADLGCATFQALGQMVANPRDLIEGVGEANPNAEAVTKGIRQYRINPPVFLVPGGNQQNRQRGGTGTN